MKTHSPYSNNTPIDSTTSSPFHAGEQELQSRVGKREKIENIGQKIIRSFMPDQHREFYEQLPFMMVGSVDEQGWPWASILPGKPGFIQSTTPTTLDITPSVIAGDPLEATFNTVGSPIGLLGIELSTRRRNRVNGHINNLHDNKLTFHVGQSFGNCPQYIQHRSVDFIREVNEKGKHYEKQTFSNLDEETCSLINTADTFFVASYVKAKDNPTVEGVDVSHRGGKPGFIKIDKNTLTIPDYPGNNAFNTLGNFLINPKAGLLFINFTTGELVMLTGTVEVLWDNNDDIQTFKGAERSWKFTLDHGIKIKDALPFRSTLGEFSPNTLMTGNWEEANAIRATQVSKNTWRSFIVNNIEDESENIRSFYLQPHDNAALLPFKAGQHLSIKLPSSAGQAAIIGTYTISSAPEQPYYRISVKKEPNGNISKYLHNNLQLHDVIDVKAPLGDFYIDPTETRPAVLIAGGVGITPMISMALHIANQGTLTRHLRPLTIFHAAKTTSQRAFEKDFTLLEQQTDGKIRYISLISQPTAYEKSGRNFTGTGRLTADIYQQILPLNDYDFYLCGPSAFMQSQYDILTRLGVNDNRIFAETFGPSSLNRTQKITHNEPNLTIEQEADTSVIKFKKSSFEQAWHAGDKTLLETAEDHGITPEFSCRTGNCGACKTALLSGKVTYRTQPTASINNNEVLLCCAVPAKGSTTVEVDL